MDVLVAPVGLQDPLSPKNQQFGSVLAIAEKVRPRLVFLLPTRLPEGESPRDPEAETYLNALETKTHLERLLPGVVVEVVTLVVRAAHLSEDVFPAVERAVDRIHQECKIWCEDDPAVFHVKYRTLAGRDGDEKGVVW
jgi:hypothetical protein